MSNQKQNGSRFFSRMISMMLALSLIFTLFAVPASAAGASVIYRAHNQNAGWSSWVSDGQIAGRQGESLRMEDLQVKLSGVSGGVKYSAHCQNYGWRSYVSNGASCGTTGESLRMEAVKIELTGAAASQYDILYRVHVAGIGTMGWVKNGAIAGTVGESRQIESIEIKLSAKSGSSTGGWQWPVSGYRVSQSFNNYSKTMAAKGRAYHCGVDLVSSKTSIYAAANGTVKYKGYSNGNGYHVILSHNVNGTTVYTLYSHLSSYSACPSVGSSVSKGAKIGVMGNTGNSTGTHLHFGIFSGSYSSDPYGYVGSSGSNKMTYKGTTYYNPSYVISNGRLP